MQFPSLLLAWMPRLRLVLELVLIACLGLFLARIAWILVDPGGAVSRPLPLPGAPLSSGPASPSASADLMALTRGSKFGASSETAAIIPDAPATSLNLKLKGVRSVSTNAGDNAAADAPIAIIQTPDNQARTYHPGDTIIDGVSLDRVLADRVLIRKNGSLETLMMESGIGALAVLSLPGQDGLIEGTPRAAAPAPENQPIDRQLLASLDINPVIKEGNLVGYRLTAPGSPAALDGSGLQSGDLITEFDGNSVQDLPIESITDRLSNAAEITLTVTRNGTPQAVTLRFAEGD
ncbi:type II secretion system protein N [Hyphomonas johnsonii]|uniref:General secretion pathway protein C n=1 Tax=Hyphomonas johnsonii MHS-2 TaxID=1280950 RepID=A0A059FUF4_9PROT|nr:type II secretion system protein N [Hyphomonas johnsonii]KCZ94309.1 general secretion pathway protein C [Hyphomonas johnsonii MHS-2]